jgi:lysophospholipase L1-like esterase
MGGRRFKLGVRKARLSDYGRMIRRQFHVFVVLIGLHFSGTAQNDASLYHVNPYNFVRNDLNQMHYPGDRVAIDNFYAKLEKLVTTGEGRINIVHIGGSHIQAGTYSGQMRNRLQTLNGDMNAGWGFMFPYRISRTNSPFGYYIRYTGSWQSMRNVESRKTGVLGVGGISATTNAEKAEMTILLEKENTIDYRFNKLRIFYQNTAGNYTISIDTALIDKEEKKEGYIDFMLKTRVDSLNIVFTKKPGSTGSFTLFGMSAESGPNGIVYNSIGVNGAHVPAYLRCQLFTEQLAALNPDLVILGIGINDAYTRRFSKERFEALYDELISEIRKAAPEAAIIFTTNNDSYLYRRYVNRNGEEVKQSMYKMAQLYGAGVWDMYSVMGGLNSIVMWQKNGLAQSDRIHFTREGYLLLADLFFSALIRDFEQHILGKPNRELTNAPEMLQSMPVEMIPLEQQKLNFY